MRSRPTQSKFINGRGLTLVEVLIATAVVSVAMLGIVGMFPVAHQQLRMGSDMTKATVLAEQMVEVLRDEPLNAVPRYDAADTREPAVFPTDDPVGTPPFRGGSLLRRWQQAIAAAPELGGLYQGWGHIETASLDRGLLSVTVTVGWSATPTDRTVQLITYLGQR